MSARVTNGKAALLLLGLALAFTFQLQIGRAGVIRTQAPAYVAPPGSGELSVQILRADGDALRETAMITLVTRQALVAEVVAEPQHRHPARFSMVPLGPVHLRIAVDGFATADLKVLLDHADRNMRVTIYLRPETKDGQVGEGWLPALSASASSHYAETVDSLRKGDLERSRQHYRKLRRNELGDPNVQYLAGVVAYGSKDTGMALFHFSQAAYLNPEQEDSARALAGLLYHTGIYGEAYEEFARLARKHPQDWNLAWQAASAAFLSAQYSEAREAATNVATQAKDPALTAMADDLLAVMGREGAAGDSGLHPLVSAQAVANLLSPDDFEPRVPPRVWAPPDVDGVRPAIVQGIPCDAAEVLKLTGSRLHTRFEMLGDVAGKVHIEQAVLGLTGRVTPLGQFTVDYLPQVLLLPNGNYAVDEFLTGAIPEPSPASAVAQGRAGLALVFAPAIQPDFTFVCEGLTQWNEHPAWSVHFTERKDRPAHLCAYSGSGRSYPAYIRGRAFVDKPSGELLHIETDLEDPIPELRLEEEHLVVDYMPMNFQSAPEPFYLPSKAELYLHIRGRLYRVREDYKDYVRFSVATHQDIKRPNEQEEDKKHEP